MNKIKILIADDVKETRDIVKKIIEFEEDFEIVGEALDGEDAIEKIKQLKPDVVLMDINMPVLNGLEATERITSQFKEVIVIIMSVQGESEYLRKAMFYGAKEYIIKPFNYDTLVNTIKLTYDRYKSIKGSDIDLRDGKVITFFSSKGGVGKTTLAVNTAIELSKNKKVLLMDLDLMFGDISIFVDAVDAKTILDVVDEENIESLNSMKSYLYNYNKNLDIMFAPKKPEASEYISREIVEKILNTLKKQYDVVVVDTGVNFSEVTLYILDICDYILFISNMDLASLKNTKLGLQVMRSLGYDKNKVKVVINRFKTDYGIGKKEAEEVFKESVFLTIADDEKTVINSINTGKPFIEGSKFLKSKIEKSIETLCRQLEI